MIECGHDRSRVVVGQPQPGLQGYRPNPTGLWRLYTGITQPAGLLAAFDRVGGLGQADGKSGARRSHHPVLKM